MGIYARLPMMTHLFNYLRLSGLLLFLLFVASSPVFAEPITDPDINDDGTVNILDVSLVAGCLYKEVDNDYNETCLPADTNGDGFIEFDDLQYVQAHFGETGFPFSKPIDWDDVVTDDDGTTPRLNRIIVMLAEDSTFEDAQDLASQCACTIVSSNGSPTGGTYEFATSAYSLTELLKIKDTLKQDPRVFIATLNLANIRQTFINNTDLHYLPEHLKRAYNGINIEHAWNLISYFDNPIKASLNVGIVDTGVDSSHKEFNQTNVTGLTEDYSPSNLCKSTSTHHGTSVAGIISADNKSGYSQRDEMNGLLTATQNAAGTTFSLDMNSDFKEIFNADSDIFNLSFGEISCDAYSINSCHYIMGMCTSPAIFEEHKKLYTESINRVSEKHKKTLFVVAAGNYSPSIHVSASTSNIIPASVDHPNVITVGATDGYNNKASFSFEGDSIDISAPGVDVYVPVAGGGYDVLSGTSFSAPMVTGVIGLMKSIDPDLDPGTIREILRETGEATDPKISGKTLNAARAIACTLKRSGHNVEDILDDAISDATLKNKIQSDLDCLEVCGGHPEKISVDFNGLYRTSLINPETGYPSHIYTTYDHLGLRIFNGILRAERYSSMSACESMLRHESGVDCTDLTAWAASSIPLTLHSVGKPWDKVTLEIMSGADDPVKAYVGNLGVYPDQDINSYHDVKPDVTLSNSGAVAISTKKLRDNLFEAPLIVELEGRFGHGIDFVTLGEGDVYGGYLWVKSMTAVRCQ